MTQDTTISMTGSEPFWRWHQSWAGLTFLPRFGTRASAVVDAITSWADGKRTRGGAKVTQNARQRTTDAKNCVRADDIAIAWRVGEWKSAFCAVLNGPSYWNARWLTREKCLPASNWHSPEGGFVGGINRGSGGFYVVSSNLDNLKNNIHNKMALIKVVNV